MTEMKIMEIIRAELRAVGLAVPDWLHPVAGSRERMAWVRICRRIADDCESEKRAAARAASMVGLRGHAG